MVNKTLNVDGMKCDHCVETVEKALRKIEGIQNVNANLEYKKVLVTYDELQLGIDTINKKIQEMGFNVLNKP